MGQKVNPNIFRLGKIKDWTSKYTYEKKTTESSTLIINDIEIKNFIYKFFFKLPIKNKLLPNKLLKKKLYTFMFHISIYLIRYYLKKKTTLFCTKQLSKNFQDKISNIKTKIIKNQLYKN